MNERNDDASDSNGPDPQEWYTGGASSGQAVIDPRERPDARLASMFDSARAHGAMDGTAEDLNPNESRGARGGAATAFRGRGRTLNSSAEEEAADEEEASAATRRARGVGQRQSGSGRRGGVPVGTRVAQQFRLGEAALMPGYHRIGVVPQLPARWLDGSRPTSQTSRRAAPLAAHCRPSRRQRAADGDFWPCCRPRLRLGLQRRGVGAGAAALATVARGWL